MQRIRSVENVNTIVDVTNNNYTTMLRCYARDNFSSIYLCCSRRYTQKLKWKI